MTKNDIFKVGETIADILNRKNNTDIYSFNFPWGVVKRLSSTGAISIVCHANNCKRETFDKLSAVREALLEVNE